MRQELTNELKCEFHTTSSRAAPAFFMIQDLRTRYRHDTFIPTYVADGPRDKCQKDATRANVEPTNVLKPVVFRVVSKV